jgi:hypothetical protein
LRIVSSTSFFAFSKSLSKAPSGCGREDRVRPAACQRASASP